MLYFCDISMPSLICHLQKRDPGNSLARGVFKELEPWVVFILVFIYCHMVEGEKALWPLPMRPLLLPIAKLWAILVENVGCSCLVTVFPVMLKPQSKCLFWPVKIASNSGRALVGWMQLDALSEARGCCHAIILLYRIYSPHPGYRLWLMSLATPCQQSTLG